MPRNKCARSTICAIFQPVIDALVQLGGSGQPSEVKELIADKLSITEDMQSEQIPSGASRFSKTLIGQGFILQKQDLLTHLLVAFGVSPKKAETPNCRIAKRSNCFKIFISNFPSKEGKRKQNQQRMLKAK